MLENNESFENEWLADSEESEDDLYSERKYIILVIYDIISDKQRVKMARVLSGYGIRVQKSAFEARLNKKQYQRLLEDIRKILKDEDNVGINYASSIVYTVFGASLWDASEQNLPSGMFCSDFSAAFLVLRKNLRIYKLYGYEEILTFGEQDYERFEDVIVI